MVFAGTCAVISLVFMIALSSSRWSLGAAVSACVGTGLTLWVATISPSAIALIVLGAMVALVLPLMLVREKPNANLWDRSMLTTSRSYPWYANLWLWWMLLGAILVGMYVKFW